MGVEKICSIECRAASPQLKVYQMISEHQKSGHSNARDPDGKSRFSEFYFEKAGTTYGGIILWRLHAWWRTSVLVDEDGYKWTVVSLRKLADTLKMDRKTMERHVKKLEDMGLLESRLGKFRNLPQKEIRVLLDDGMTPVNSSPSAPNDCGAPTGGIVHPDYGSQ